MLERWWFQVRSVDMMNGFSIFFGLFGILYILVALFIVVLTIVFLFKAISFMTRKNQLDQERNETLKELLHQFESRNRD
ncbi:MAG TPA: hypothetical protein VF149_04160 [Bacillales bacterium]